MLNNNMFLYFAYHLKLNLHLHSPLSKEKNNFRSCITHKRDKLNVKNMYKY